MYAAMATEQLAGARVPGNNEESMKGAKSGSSIGIPGTLADLQGQGGSGAGAGAGAVGNGVQERVRADLMLAVLYDMLGRYEESDGYLAAAVDVSPRAPFDPHATPEDRAQGDEDGADDLGVFWLCRAGAGSPEFH